MTDREYFEAWFVQVLENLYPNREAGFAIVLIAFPLLERYLRQKTGIGTAPLSHQKIYDGLLQIFPELVKWENAKEFWEIHRNGLLHQCTFSAFNRAGRKLADGVMSHDRPIDFDEKDARCWLNPVAFARKVIKTISDDFPTFEGSTPSLPVVKDHKAPAGSIYSEISATMGPAVILGTSRP